MTLLNNTLRFTSKVVTFGGSTKVEEAKLAYNEVWEEYQPLFDQVDNLKKQIDVLFKQVGIRLKSIDSVLQQVQAVLNQKCEIEEVTNSTQVINSINTFNTSFNAAANAGFGSVVGGTTAVGAWALVSTVGSASTGASIAGLSGVAASNATLAWFGGGSLAAGGAGMTGGMAALGGIVAVPVLYFASKGAYKKAQKIVEATEELNAEISKLKVILPQAKVELNQVQQQALFIEEISARYEMMALRILHDIAELELKKFKWYKPTTWFSNEYSSETILSLKEVLALETERYLAQLNHSSI
ncbi:hypothetical protein VIN01S_22560 [Vibrio inusitatus NBRC 102082]|uniref:Uncharacterized protein n=1 Tax=Vibrio inusitatus NBRC 102082 TaxID=1219070 RepID=A0A4Y3HXM6_9VIBR|nr:hypothetical protein [Vibrio inusitatus]GEA51452.1 hypothetical protein VIN01S_22560 [Vibrio inusitatus NBRC 102082]